MALHVAGLEAEGNGAGEVAEGVQAGGFEEREFGGPDVGRGVSEDDAANVLKLTSEAEVVEHAIPLVGFGVDVFEEEDGGLSEVEGIGGAEGFGEDGEAAAEESAFGLTFLKHAEAVGGGDGPGGFGVEGGAPGTVVDAFGVGPVGGGHGGVEGGEMAEVPEVEVE
jgi:hypothetical protein